MAPSTGARVLVTDAQDVPGLAAIRCLGASGYQVLGGALGPRAAGLRSRYCRQRLVLPDPRSSLSGFAGALAQIVQAESPDAVVACRDETVLAISTHRERLPPAARRGLPDAATVQRAFDRDCLAVEAAAAGLPVPEQRLCSTAEAAIEAARAFGWPVLVKSAASTYTVGGRVDRQPSESVADPEALRAQVAAIGACVVQRHVSGRIVSVGGVAAPQGLLGAVVSTYLRTWPVQAGRSSYTETLPARPGLLARVETLVAAIGWTGMFELELIETEAGALHAIDFNPRPYGSLALARPAGAPLCKIWCDWLLTGRAEPLRVARPGVRFRNEARELSNLSLRLHEGTWASAAQILRPRRNTVHAVFDVSDPLPAVVSAAAAARTGLRKRRG